MIPACLIMNFLGSSEFTLISRWVIFTPVYRWRRMLWCLCLYHLTSRVHWLDRRCHRSRVSPPSPQTPGPVVPYPRQLQWDLRGRRHFCVQGPPHTSRTRCLSREWIRKSPTTSSSPQSRSLSLRQLYTCSCVLVIKGVINALLFFLCCAFDIMCY